MKKILLILAIIVPTMTFAQDTEKKQQTTFEKFTSSYGSLIKITDYKLPNLPSKFETGKVEVRKVTSNGTSQCFLHISFKESTTHTEFSADIAQNDIVELKKAIEELQAQVGSDNITDANYLENKFTTVDGLVMGYYIEKNNGGPVWFIRLEPSSWSYLRFKAPNPLVTTFDAALEKMNELK